MINYIRVGAGIPRLEIADCDTNRKHILSIIDIASTNNVDILSFPELSLTGYTCQDLFFQSSLIDSAMENLKLIINYTENLNTIIVIGMPIEVSNNLLNCGVVIFKGEVLGIVPKTFLSYEDDEDRYFSSSQDINNIKTIKINNKDVPIGNNIIFSCNNIKNFTFSIDIGADLFAMIPPSISNTLNGGNIIINPSGINTTIGKEEYIKNYIQYYSKKIVSTYIHINAGTDESTSNTTYNGKSFIFENGNLLSENESFVYNSSQIIYTDTDLELISSCRKIRKNHDLKKSVTTGNVIEFNMNIESYHTKRVLKRFINPHPFVENNKTKLNVQCESVFNIQSAGIIKRLQATKIKNAVIGISGGLDSTLALIGLIKAFEKIGKSRKDIIGITMPGFGTSDITYKNSIELMDSFIITKKEISIKDSTLQHFIDIGHDENIHDITYENAQARERTKILMDIANKENGMVIGTGDLSEIALGWSTYNGDHMSMYGINSGIPKTLIPHLIKYYIENEVLDDNIKQLLSNVIQTPVSPELLPPSATGEITQKTEDIVGPYELVDFYMYNILKYGFTAKKIIHMAYYAFNKKYDFDFLIHYLKEFYRRFFNSQFKRSAMPDGIKIFDFNLSPKNDFKMPSDASFKIWKDELENIKY